MPIKALFAPDLTSKIIIPTYIFVNFRKINETCKVPKKNEDPYLETLFHECPGSVSLVSFFDSCSLLIEAVISKQI